MQEGPGRPVLAKVPVLSGGGEERGALPDRDALELAAGGETVNPALLSSKSGEWETPQAFFDRLNWKYHFTLDAAATADNAKCSRFFTKDDDGISKNWGGGGRSYGAIRPMAGRSENGCARVTRNRRTPSW